jgi:tRNA dimethylallyltransferase
VKRNKTLLVITGPTAAGKTGLALQLAEKYTTEIISADSRQIYREMTIGTAKPSPTELTKIKHHFIDSHTIAEDYDAARFGQDALQVIHKLFATHDVAVLCGGSGLYIRAVCEGFDDIPSVPDEVRDDLIKNFKLLGIEWLQQQMLALDPEHFSTIDQSNPHRLIRALEVKIGTGNSIAHFRKSEKLRHNFKILKIGLELPRNELYERIDQRMDKMITDGLFEEAKSLYPFKEKNALQTVGYQEVFNYIENKYDYAETVRLLKRNSRRYAKRQLTWFKRDTEIHWFDPLQVEEIVRFVEREA